MSDVERKLRKQRALFIYSATSFAIVALTIFLIWSLRELILPALVGALTAYLCRPMLKVMKKKGLSHGVSILVLFALFVLAIMGITQQVQDLIPDDKGKLVLRVRTQYKLTEKYNQIMGVDAGEDQIGVIRKLIKKEVKPAFSKLLNALMLGPHERITFEYYSQEVEEEEEIESGYYDYFLKNITTDQKRLGKNYLRATKEDPNENKENQSEEESILATVGEIISLWIAAPFVFLFLLLDEGQIKKSLVYPVPNRYFEMILTIIDNVDDAIGNYLRGTLLESSMVGMTFACGLYLVGIELQVAILIGMVAGAANAIPFLGPAIGLLIGVGYSLIAEQISPVLPGVTLNNIVLWVLGVVAIAQLLDNAVFQPIILGSAVSLHPLVVIIGVMGGGILLGFAGMLFAIPTIVVFKVIFTTFFTEMKAYHII